MRFTVILCLLTIAINSIFGQKPIDIKLSPSSKTTSTSCFDIQLRSSAGYDINLAGQNYRLFFNGHKADFRDDMITHSLDKRTYGKLDVLHSSDDDIGFVSISLDSRIYTEEILVLDRKGAWHTTLNICFDHDPTETLDLTWADARKTSRFATAEIAFSEWIDEDHQQILEPQEVEDFSSADYSSTTDELVLSLYPNPTTDILSVELNGNNEDRTLIIKDIIGREYIYEGFDGRDIRSIDVRNWPEGSYSVVIADNQGKYVTSKNIVKINP